MTGKNEDVNIGIYSWDKKDLEQQINILSPNTPRSRQIFPKKNVRSRIGMKALMT